MRKWLPLAPSGMPGVWRDLSNMLPVRSGAYYTANRAASGSTAASAPASPGTLKRAWCALLESDTAIRYLGTTTKVWEWDGTTGLTDRSRAALYTNTTTDWSFAQYGNITIACNRIDETQFRDSTSVTAFADLANAPKARIAVTQAEQVLLFDLNDGAEKPNAFAVCAPGDYTDWTGAGATTATRIRHRPGKITAAVAFRDYVLAFKKSSVYKLTYTGGTYKWRVELIAIGRGAWGKHDVVHTGDEVVFSGPGGAWRFDGASFRPITDWFGQLASGTVGSLYCPLSANVIFHYGSNAQYYAYNMVSDRWGKSNEQTALLPMTGEPAALDTVVAPTTAFPDKLMQFDTDLTAVGALGGTTTNRWGGTVHATANLAYIFGGEEGIGNDVTTHFGRLVPDWSYSLPASAATTSPANTGLDLDVYVGESKDDTNIVFNTAKEITAQSSYGAQRRFEINRVAVYCNFRIRFHASGYSEIADYDLAMKPSGKV